MGETLRDASAVVQVVVGASRLLGATLDTSRAGYATIDLVANTFRVEEDWAAPGVESLAGTSSLDGFKATMARVKQGEVVTVANIPAAQWLARDTQAFEAIEAKAYILVPLMRRGKLVGVMYVHSAAPRTWSSANVDFVQAVADQAYAAVAKLQAEAEQQLLNDELSHRLKNTLSMVQAIARQTLKNVADSGAIDAFSRRLSTLSKAHNVLLQQSWAAARITSVVEGALALESDLARFDTHRTQRQSRSEGRVVLVDAAARASSRTPSSMARCRAPRARSRSHGRSSCANGGPELVVTWAESSGPPAKDPTSRLRLRLIGLGLSGTGKADLRYTVDRPARRISRPVAFVDRKLGLSVEHMPTHGR